MFPIPILMWESDATARVQVEQSYAANALEPGQSIAMSGGEGSLDFVTREPLTQYGLRLNGLYARAVGFSLGPNGDQPPLDSMSAGLGTMGAWQLSPYTHLTLDGAGFLATTLGIRAYDTLAARDPFMGNRLQYTIGGGPTLTVADSRTSFITLGAGYLQAGALWAEMPDAVGVDAHTGRARAAYTEEFGHLDLLTPEVRYEYTHFYHAIRDVNLTRGPADVQVGTLLLTETHLFTRMLRGSATGGVSVATPPPIVDSKAVVVSPDARVALTLFGRRYAAEGSYEYSYTSLGPRIGYGNAHAASAQLSLRPHDGGAYRDFWIRGIGSFTYGAMPVAASPPLNTGFTTQAQPPPNGTLTTYIAVGGGRVDYPIFRGLVVTGGFDVEYLRAIFDPVTPVTQPTTTIATIWTIGIAGVLSSDPERRVGRPQEELPDERAPHTPTEVEAGAMDPRAAAVRSDELGAHDYDADAERAALPDGENRPEGVDAPKPDPQHPTEQDPERDHPTAP